MPVHARRSIGRLNQACRSSAEGSEGRCKFWQTLLPQLRDGGARCLELAAHVFELACAHCVKAIDPQRLSLTHKLDGTVVETSKS